MSRVADPLPGSCATLIPISTSLRSFTPRYSLTAPILQRKTTLNVSRFFLKRKCFNSHYDSTAYSPFRRDALIRDRAANTCYVARDHVSPQ